MPHIVPKTTAARSPADIIEALGVITGAGIKLLGVGGSNLETGGLLSLMVEEEDVPKVVRLWTDAGYKDAAVYGEPEGQHLDYVSEDHGGLSAAIGRARQHHPDLAFSDITMGAEVRAFWVHPDGELVRNPEGYPVENGDSGGAAITALPVQIYFVQKDTGTPAPSA
jgi:hypothetical protein